MTKYSKYKLKSYKMIIKVQNKSNKNITRTDILQSAHSLWLMKNAN